MSKYNWRVKKEGAINSKILHTIVREYVEEGLEHANVVWANQTHRDSFVAVINDMMEMLLDEDKITQWKIVCDGRNNTTADMNSGLFFIDITYKQRNCVNNTYLQYEITKK